jgi:hypothetical protein
LQGATGRTQPPKYWVLVHAGDETAKKSILQTDTYAKAVDTARVLGYEPVIEGETAYFFPIPAWSDGVGQATVDLLNEAVSNGFPCRLPADGLQPSQREHLSRFLAYWAPKVGGEFARMMRESKLSTVSVERSVDLKFRFGDQEVVVPVGDRDMARWFPIPKEKSNVTPTVAKQYPNRKELFGLGTQNFAISTSRPISSQNFRKLLDRAKDMLNDRTEAFKKELQNQIDSAFQQLMASEEAQKLKNGGALGFGDLPKEMQKDLLKRGAENPKLFGTDDASLANSRLSSAFVSIPQGGLRVFLGFRFKNSTSGAPEGNGVGWEITELLR